MITKNIIAIMVIGLFTVSTVQAQDKKNNENIHEHLANDKELFTCSMHPEVKSDKPGECPKCGMSLKKIEMKKAYDRMDMKQDSMKMMHGKMGMHQDSMKMMHGIMKMNQDSMKMMHGKMDMKQDSVKVMHGKMGLSQDKITKTFTCSMHPEVNSDKPGKCPKCGMMLIETKMDKKKEVDNKTKKHNHQN